VKKNTKKNNWIDITVTVGSGMVHWPSDPPVEVKRVKDMEKGESTNVSLITMGSHTGTHMDAPFHFFRRGKSLDKLPLDAAIGKARVIGIKDRERISREEIESCRIKKGERIIFKTANSRLWGTDSFNKNFVYISPEAAQYLASREVRLVGIDYFSVGAYHKDGARTHKELLGSGIWLIEGLDLRGVKPGNYELICLPLKILNSDGAPARAVISPR
jgi:arylformamidase